MATIKVVDVINRANKILNDVTKVRWPEDELLGWFNDAIKAVVARRPDTSVMSGIHRCTQSSMQKLPANALNLVDVTHNANGNAITKIDRHTLDEQHRDWHRADRITRDVQHYVYDDRKPKVFYLFPVPVSGLEVYCDYSVAPENIAITDFVNDTQLIPFDDVYGNPLIDFILYRAYSKDAEYAGNAERANYHFQAFKVSLGDKSQSDAALSPNSRG